MSRSRRPASQVVTTAVLVVMVAVVAASTVGTRQLVSSQEHKLLKQRTDELGLVINDLTPTVLDQLAPLAAAAKAASFTASAKVPSGARDAVLLALGPGSATVVGAVGPDFRAGQVLTGPLYSAASAARAAPTFVVSSIYSSGSRHFAAVASTAGVPVGEAVAQVSVVTPFSPNANNRTGPYSELYVALYRGTTVVRSQLVEANGPLSSFGSRTATEIVHLGTTPLVLVTAARGSLVGSVELNAQWFVLGFGLLLTLLLGLVFVSTQRRRDYALDLVDERTAELNDSLVQLRQTQDQLVHRERLAAIGELASAVGHELRNPLAVISNALYLLRRATNGSEDGRVSTHLSTAEREVAAATLIVSDLLEYSRAREPILAEVDLGDLVAETLAVSPHPETVVVDWDPPAAPVRNAVDRDQMRQVLLNLVTNAYDAMPEGGRLRLGLRDGDGATTFEVSDNGSGMDESTKARIFEPFFTTKARGVGLGLAVTHRIVASHGGSILVQSAPEAGTTFTVVIPDGRVPGEAQGNGKAPA